MAQQRDFAREIKELESRACKFWPDSLEDHYASTSGIVKLSESHDKFIGILQVADISPTAWQHVLGSTADLPANLFLKHLMALTGIGIEPLKRVHTYLFEFF